MQIKRILHSELTKGIDWKKVIILLGPRQVGKTTLVEELASQLVHDYLLLTGDEFQTVEFLSNPNLEFLKSFVKPYNPVTTQVIHKDNFWQWLGDYPYTNQNSW